MPNSDDDAPRARRERRSSSSRNVHAKSSKSPNRKLDFVSDEAYDIDEGEKSVDSGNKRRTSLANFSASKLLETMKDSSATPLARLRSRAAEGEAETTTTTPPPPPALPASSMTPTPTTRSGRRTPGRTMSAQGSRTNRRPMRSENADVLSQSMVDDSNGSSTIDLSSQSQSRRRLPQRSRSAQDACLPRGHAPPTQRGPRSRRRPDRDDLGEESELGMSSRRRGAGMPRSRSSHEQTRGAAARTPRSARRRAAAADDDDSDDSGSVIISDSDESSDDNNNSGPRNNMGSSSRYRNDRGDDIDHSTTSATTGNSRRRRPQRTVSTDSGMPATRGAGRTARAARRRPSAGDGSPARRPPSVGPALARSNTAPSNGPGLMRSNTANNPRSGRVRGSRDTARELAQVTANRERSPDPSLVSADLDNNKHSVSPIKTRQERRRLREDKEREGLERRMQQQEAEEEEEELVPEKKEAPWMRRLKKNIGGAKMDDDSLCFDDGAGNRHEGLTNHDSGGTRNTLGSAGTKEFFPVDPTFGVFAAEPLKNTQLSMDDDDDPGDADAFASMMGAADNVNKKKLDFSSIS